VGGTGVEPVTLRLSAAYILGAGVFVAVFIASNEENLNALTR